MNSRPYVRTKKRPPSGTRCDSHVGVDPESRAPRLLRCPNQATVEFKGGPLPFETWVCESCAKVLETPKERT